MTPEELFDDFIPAYLHVLITDALLTGHAGELINTSLDEFIKPWCERIRSMTSAAVQAEREVASIVLHKINDRLSELELPHKDILFLGQLMNDYCDRARTTTEGEGRSDEDCQVDR